MQVWSILWLLMGIAIPGQAATYYLNTSTGSASNPGTINNPWKTMAEVASKTVAGDIVVIQQADADTYAALWPNHVSYRANTIQQFGITWKFSESCTAGQFANGDFWVIGPVTITGITPASTAAADGRVMNGSMVNPNPREGSQGYDSSMVYNTYSGGLNVAFNRSAINPLVLQPGSSLVSTISVAAAGVIPQLQRAAVLTILASVPAAGSFRPPYAGTDKTVKFNKSGLDYSLLRSLPPVAETPSLSSVENAFAAPWIDHKAGFSQRMQHPSLNMPNYGQDVHGEIGTGGLMLHLNFPVEQKQTLMVRYVQLGIDLYGIIDAGGIWNWANDGGHAGGRKWPILFAGMVLNDPEMKSIGQKSGDYLYANGYGPGNCPGDYIHFGEDDQTFYVSEQDVALTSGPSWKPDTRNGAPAPYTQADIGMPEWGIIHATYPQNSDKALHAIYRGVAGPPFNSTALAALLTPGAKELWNHDAYFDYTDRYQAFTGPGGAYEGYWHTWSKFIDNMWHTYRPLGGPVWPETAANGNPVLSLIGDKQVTAGQTLTFTAAATDSDSDALTYTATGLPAGATFTNRVFSWTPGTSAVGTHQVTFTVSDGSAQDSETITITVVRVNAAPILGGIGNKSVNENQSLSFSISASDADGDALMYSASGMPSGASFTGQTFTWKPGYSQSGAYNVTFTVGDGKAQDSETITISVANVNRPPALAAVGDRSVDEDNTLSVTLSAADPDGTALTYSATGLPTGAELAGRNFTWTPTAGQAGSYEITFTVSDGALTDSETIAVAVVSTSTDATAPVVGRQSPSADAIQVPLNNLVALHITDAGKGVAPESVTIRLDGKIVYQGDTALYTSDRGKCSRSGVKNDYLFIYQNDSLFDSDHEAVVTVNAADRASNVMSESTYSFATEMRAFGANKRVSSTTSAAKGAPVTVGDSNGNVWVAWHAGEVGARDIYVARLTAGRQSFDAPVQLTSDFRDQCDPDLAMGEDGTLYVVWQDNRQGHWDIFGATSTNGRTFSKETAVVDANDDQIAPTVATAGGSVYMAWQDGRNGNQDIYVGSSTNAFAAVTATRVTTNTEDQTQPDLAVGADNAIYLVWTDKRNGDADIYGAVSAASWANVPLVTSDGDQTSPAIAIAGSEMHLLWVDAGSGDADIWYASSNGLSGSPLTGRNIVDDTSGAGQTAPALTCTNDGKVFACWQDLRNVGTYGDDADVYFAELSSGCAGTNVLISDGGARSGQSEPTIALTTDNAPYVVWADDRNTAAEIYCAATTYLGPTPLYSGLVDASSGATIGVNPSTIAKTGDVSIVVPAGACQIDLRVTISEIQNPLISSTDCLGSYDFGPSGIEFAEPVTVTIPYQVAAGSRRARAYWYNSLTGALSQQGITEVSDLTISGNLYALQFKTTHFTPYYLVASDSDVVASSSNDGGGCSMSATGGGSPKHLLVPYAIVVVFLAILRRKDRKAARTMSR